MPIMRLLSLFQILLFWAISFSYSTTLDLQCKVISQNKTPIQGATIYIYTASPRIGTSPYCPSCYPDCGKRQETDQAGTARIQSLNSKLIFRILVVAEGYEPTFVTEIDPMRSPIEVILKPVNESPTNGEYILKGHIIDPDGKPVVGATIEPIGINTPQGKKFGYIPEADPLSISNKHGEFSLPAKQANASLDIKVTARGLATKIFRDLVTGKTVYDLKMTNGVTVTGHIVKEGKPLSEISIRLIKVDKTIQNFTGPDEIGTDDQGHFAFNNISPNCEYYIYGKMKSLAELGGSEVKKIQVGSDGETIDAGTLQVGPAHRVSGHVILSDGKPIPSNTKIALSHVLMADSQIIDLDNEGRFEFKGVPSGVFRVAIRLPEYHVSLKNKSCDISQFYIIGQVNQDIPDLTILLEPGDPPRSITIDQTKVDRKPEESTLEGIKGPTAGKL